VPSEYTPRLSIELTEEQHERLSNLISWGQKRALFSAIVDGLIPLLEQYGSTLIAVVASGKLTMADLFRLFNEQKEGEEDGSTRTKEEHF